ncbi:MAG: methyltransferase [Cellulomonadaceae bacterium]|nr:methyltransferase [Cellulomonadaceae bacterium]
MTSSGPPTDAPSPSRPEVAALRADLIAADLSVAAVEDLLGPVAAAALHREQAVPALRATAGRGDALATLVRLLLLGRSVPRHALDAALPTLGTDGAARLGLVDAAGHAPDDDVCPLVDLRPYASADAAGPVTWWLASDLGELVTGAALRADHVLGVGGASTTLAQVTMRSPRGRTLDLGTGCGVQALHASRHSGTVVATDVSRRALAFARFNAALAGVDLDLRLGSMLEPVAGEEFDLVVSNPPFVITPRTDHEGPVYEYRDGGRAGDDLVRDLVVGLGQALAPGGVAQLLGNWEHRGGDWRERVGEWIDSAGLDGWVVQREVLDPAQYAETWLRDGGTTRDRDPAGWDAGYAAWLDDFATRGVEAVGLGLVVLRRPTSGGPTLRRLEDQPGPVRQPLGEHLEAALAAHDWLAGHGDALLDAHLVVAPDVTEERHLMPGADDPTVVLLRQGGGFGRTVQVGTALAGLVGACDGDLSVGQIIGALGSLLDVPEGDLRAQLVPAATDLVRDGLLVPAPPG